MTRNDNAMASAAMALQRTCVSALNTRAKLEKALYENTKP
jgi:hypothetical protein